MPATYRHYICAAVASAFLLPQAAAANDTYMWCYAYKYRDKVYLSEVFLGDYSRDEYGARNAFIDYVESRYEYLDQTQLQLRASVIAIEQVLGKTATKKELGKMLSLPIGSINLYHSIGAIPLCGGRGMLSRLVCFQNIITSITLLLFAAGCSEQRELDRGYYVVCTYADYENRAIYIEKPFSSYFIKHTSERLDSNGTIMELEAYQRDVKRSASILGGASQNGHSICRVEFTVDDARERVLSIRNYYEIDQGYEVFVIEAVT